MARAVVKLQVRVKNLERRQAELEAEAGKMKKDMELRLGLLEDEVRKW